MRRPSPTPGAGLVFLALLAALPARAQDVSPGPLSAPHAPLDNVKSCTRCHVRGDQIDAQRCLGCHTVLAARIAAKAGYHARTGSDCASCHPEHNGRAASLVRWPGGAAERFDHAANTAFPLVGAHARLACRDCHNPTFERGAVPAGAGARTYLGLDRRCAACHPDAHQPTLGAACDTCHDQVRWANARTSFDHAATRFPLRGAHAGVACARCHPADERGALKLSGIAFASCSDCHADPHAGKMGDARSCTRCHDESGWRNVRYRKSAHAPTRAPLVGRHAGLACSACHGVKLDRMPAGECAGCHADPHQPSLGKSCSACHTPAGWKPARFTAGDHARTGFPLTGKHRGVPCASCHTVGGKQVYRPIAHDTCARCHRDPHGGELADRPDGGRCDACHTTDGWRPVRFGVEDHARTGFPLEGAHRAVPCRACHPGLPGKPGFRRGRLACGACHADPHAGQFVGRRSGARGCPSCHTTERFSPSTIDARRHGELTGFALDGNHAAPCARCHRRAAPGEPVRYVGTPRECGGCHADAHAGQFAGRACTTCHQGSSFEPTGFDHAQVFPLEGRHGQAACGRCHPRLPGSGGVTVYRLGERRCDACHRSPHGEGPRGARLGQATADCAACHDSRGFRPARRPARGFDHALTGAPLTGAHAGVDCGACHRADRQRPRMADCSSCHADPHGGARGDRCETCHSTASWTPDRRLLAHRQTRFPLLGAHAVAACEDCHRDTARGDFGGLSPACESCHEHTLTDRPVHPPHVGPDFASCGRCHSPLGWRPALFNHTVFPLTGAHLSVPCSGCHAAGYAGTPRTCAGCHGGDEARSRANHGAFGDRRSCERCHGTTAWAPARAPEHPFPLLGTHAATPCNACHSDGASMAVFDCTGCHAPAAMRRAHAAVPGYAHDSRACVACHPSGRAP